MKRRAPASESPCVPTDRTARIHRWVVVLLQAVMAFELAAVLASGQRLAAFSVVLIMAITAAPILFRKRLPVNIPPEFQMLAISSLGWWYMIRERQSFIEVWIRRFIEQNQGFSDHHKPSAVSLTSR